MGNYIFPGHRVSVVSVLSPTMILVSCQEHWNKMGDFRIIKIKYSGREPDAPLLYRDPEAPLDI